MDNIHVQNAIGLLSQGDPPLILQLLVVNVLWVVAYIALHMRGRNKVRRSTVRMLQVVMLGLNITVLTIPGSDLYRFIGA